MNKINSGFFSNLKNDIPSGIVVFLVALPLCLGIALASGAPPFSGIVAGIVGGIVVAFLSGSPLGVSGPAAGLAVIVLTAIQDLGAFEIFLCAVVISGVIQFILGIIQAGIIGHYFPSSVIKGMLSGIGVIIFLKQIPHAFGYDKDYEGDLDFIQPDGHNTFTELTYMLEAISPAAIIISMVSLTILILWERPFMKKHKWFSIVPGPLVAVLAGIFLNILFDNMAGIGLKGEHLVILPVATDFGSFIGQFTLPDFTQFNNPKVLGVAATIAIVGSLETLLSVEATDKLDPYRRITPTNRELRAQGIGNMISGLIGGLPLTQVIVRSSANIQSGGKSKASAVFHGILLLGTIILIPNILNMIPLASLAAVLLLVGYKLANPKILRQMFKMGHVQWIPYLVTVIGIIFTDLLIGITMGMIVAIFFILYTNLKVPYIMGHRANEADNLYHLELSQNVSFLNKAGILKSLEHLPNDCKVVIDGSRSRYIHTDVLEIIENFEFNAKSRNITVEHINLDIKRMLHPELELRERIFRNKKANS